MRSVTVLPDGITYSADTSACAKGELWQQALDLFETMLDEGASRTLVRSLLAFALITSLATAPMEAMRASKDSEAVTKYMPKSIVAATLAEAKETRKLVVPGFAMLKTRTKPATKAGMMEISGKGVKVKAEPAKTVVKAFPVTATMKPSSVRVSVQEGSRAREGGVEILGHFRTKFPKIPLTPSGPFRKQTYGRCYAGPWLYRHGRCYARPPLSSSWCREVSGLRSWEAATPRLKPDQPPTKIWCCGCWQDGFAPPAISRRASHSLGMYKPDTNTARNHFGSGRPAQIHDKNGI